MFQTGLAEFKRVAVSTGGQRGGESREVNLLSLIAVWWAVRWQDRNICDFGRERRLVYFNGSERGDKRRDETRVLERDGRKRGETERDKGIKTDSFALVLYFEEEREGEGEGGAGER